MRLNQYVFLGLMKYFLGFNLIFLLVVTIIRLTSSSSRDLFDFSREQLVLFVYPSVISVIVYFFNKWVRKYLIAKPEKAVLVFSGLIFGSVLLLIVFLYATT